MANLRVELKNIKTFRGMEGYGVNANVYINGVKCMFIYDSGDGGMMNFEHNVTKNQAMNDRVKSCIEALEAHIKTLPAVNRTGSGKLYPVTLEDFINDLLVEQEKQKVIKKMEKRMQTAILIGVPNADRYSYFDFKRPLSTIPKTTLQVQVNLIKAKNCSGGIQILNTNLEALGINI